MKTEWDIYASVNYDIIGSTNGMLRSRQRQAIVLKNAGLLLVEPMWTNFCKFQFQV